MSATCMRLDKSFGVPYCPCIDYIEGYTCAERQAFREYLQLCVIHDWVLSFALHIHSNGQNDLIEDRGSILSYWDKRKYGVIQCAWYNCVDQSKWRDLVWACWSKHSHLMFFHRLEIIQIHCYKMNKFSSIIYLYNLPGLWHRAGHSCESTLRKQRPVCSDHQHCCR